LLYDELDTCFYVSSVHRFFWLLYGVVYCFYNNLTTLLTRNIDRQHRNQYNRLIILLTGLGAPKSQFMRLFNTLQSTILKSDDLIVIFKPKFGQTLNEDIIDLEKFIITLGLSSINSCILIGHSRGGLLAYEFLKKHNHYFNKSSIITLSTPWRSISLQEGWKGLRGSPFFIKTFNKIGSFIVHKADITKELLNETSWNNNQNINLLCLAGKYDPIVGDPAVQAPRNIKPYIIPASHLSLPTEQVAINQICDFVKNQ